jgi:anthranilate synthase
MCSDVDRNDKSRVCEPGSVKVIGRRQIEMYSRLIHTVDHIEGRLRDDMDAFDGFLSHAWAVTVTGAPKLWAMRFLENNEKSPRAWYGGAIGMVGFNGDMNTGLTLRTIRVKDGIAEVRAGATLLFDSNPEEEEAETELKASAMLSAIRDARLGNAGSTGRETARLARAYRSCWSITRIPSCTHWPIISARPAPRSPPCARPWRRDV